MTEPTSSQPTQESPNDDAAPAFKVGETVVVEGVVTAVWPRDGYIPAGLQVQFKSAAQPDGGWSRTPVPADIVRLAPKGEEAA